MMENKILEETTNFCKECPSNTSCPEDECVLFRIEQIVQDEKSKTSKALELLENYTIEEGLSLLELEDILRGEDDEGHI